MESSAAAIPPTIFPEAKMAIQESEMGPSRTVSISPVRLSSTGLSARWANLAMSGGTCPGKPSISSPSRAEMPACSISSA